MYRRALCVWIVVCVGWVEAEEELLSLSIGFRAIERLASGPDAIGGLTYGPQGQPIVYNVPSGEVRIHEPTGFSVLARMTPKTYGAFLVLAPGGTHVIFAPSIFDPTYKGEIYSIPLSGGEPRVLDAIPTAFDLVFDDSGRGFVSALTPSEGNHIVLLDDDPARASREVVVRLPGFSGPVAVDPAGNLYYATADLSRPPGTQSLLRFSREQIEGALTGDPLDSSAGKMILDEIGGLYNLKWCRGVLVGSVLPGDSTPGGLVMIEPANNFSCSSLGLFGSTEIGRLVPSFISFRPGSLGFAAGVGPQGGSVLVCYSDFVTTNSVVEILPEAYFVRGRVNRDEEVDLSDAVAILMYLFGGSPPSDPPESSDVNDDGTVDLSDSVYLLNYLFLGGPAIPPPFPDPGPDA